MISAYESEVRILQGQKIALREKVQNFGQPLGTFDETYRTALEFIANPYNLWISDLFEDKRKVLKLVFEERLRYTRNVGLRTPALSLPFCLIGQLKGSDYDLVELRGIEPLTS